jgi:hypothetical protein
MNHPYRSFKSNTMFERKYEKIIGEKKVQICTSSPCDQHTQIPEKDTESTSILPCDSARIRSLTAIADSAFASLEVDQNASNS